MPAATPLVDGREDSELALEKIRLGADETLAIGDGEYDSLFFAHDGGGLITLAGETQRLDAPAAALLLAGEDAMLAADAGGVAVVRATVGSGTDRHAPLGKRDVVVKLDGDASDHATGARSFQLLLGPHNGSTRATLFMGFVPPGKAPWHYHLYDEIVWIPEGPGRLHLGDGVEELGPGSSFRLRPRELHIVENAGLGPMQVLGVFTPAGSPSAAYLPK
jgi:mannose-6-phosphate isomerase-like protein (cupin superfamily)